MRGNEAAARTCAAALSGPSSVILAEAAPMALGKELVTHHGFRWVMLDSGGTWRYGVMHPALGRPIDLASLEDGSWNDKVDEMPPDRGETTNDSLDAILARVGRTRFGA